MASPTFYAAGTVSVANADTTVTGVGTAWVGKVYPGDLFADPLQPMVPPQRVASVTDDTHLVLWAGWPGTTIAAGAYEVRITPDTARVQEHTRLLLEALGSAANVGFDPPVGMTADDVQAAIEELKGDLDGFQALPAGGATGQVLTKQSGTDGDADWETIFDLPAGGSTGQVLSKASSTDGDAAWTTPAMTLPAAVASSLSPAKQEFAEQTTNGANKTTLQSAPALGADNVVTLPSITGTVLTGPTTTTDNTLARFDGTGGVVQTSLMAVDDAGNISAFGGQIAFPATQNPSSDANTLDDYEEGTFTPGVSFGGAAVGVTYTVQTGVYRKLGSLIWFALNVVLTSKGSSTGNALITGLPFSVAVAATPPNFVGWANMASLTVLGALVSGTTVIPHNQGATGITVLTNSNFTNTSNVYASGSYVA